MGDHFQKYSYNLSKKDYKFLKKHKKYLEFFAETLFDGHIALDFEEIERRTSTADLHELLKEVFEIAYLSSTFKKNKDKFKTL